LAAVVGVTRALVDRLSRRHVVCRPAIVYGFAAIIAAVLLTRFEWLEFALETGPVGWVGAMLLAVAVTVGLSRLEPPMAEARGGSGRPRVWAVGVMAIGVMAVAAAAATTAPRMPKGKNIRGSGDRRPNILFLTIDALRADAVGCLSETAPPTPEIDELASRGIAFRNAYVQATWTLPSFASMMTSVYPFETGIGPLGGGPSDDSSSGNPVATLAELLGANGYHTVAQLTNGFLTEKWGVIRGFSEVRHARDPRPYFQRAIFWLIRTFGNRQYGEEADGLTRGAVAWLDEGRAEPVFLWVHYLDPHEPYTPPGTNTLLASEFAALARAAEQGDSRQKASARSRLRELYKAEVRYSDHHVGELLDAVEECGLADRTVVILAADHGEAFWEHGVRGHGRAESSGREGYHHDEVLRVPLIIAFPDGRQAGTVINQPVRMLDIMPTILALADVEIPEHVRGNSLIELLASAPSEVEGGAEVLKERLRRWAEERDRARAQTRSQGLKLSPAIRRDLKALGYL
jgi:arylsulfatase A-like enzyme